jgi:hypothetical protein
MDLKSLVPKIHSLRHTAAPGSPFLFSGTAVSSQKLKRSDHAACGPASDLMKDIGAAYSFRNKTLPAQHLAHIMKQAQKSGIRAEASQVRWAEVGLKRHSED